MSEYTLKGLSKYFGPLVSYRLFACRLVFMPHPVYMLMDVIGFVFMPHPVYMLMDVIGFVHVCLVVEKTSMISI